MDFYDFYFIMESTFGGEDPMSMNVDDVQLQGSGGSLYYVFQMDNENYTVGFSKTSVNLTGSAGGQRITNDAYSITLKGPNGYELTGRGKAMTVYKNLIKSVVKLVKQEKPEGLQFYGALPEQDIMYANFYEKFLHKAYTKVSRKDYLRNDFIEQIKSSGDQRWDAIEKGIKEQESSDEIAIKRREKEQKRVRRQQLASSIGQYRDAVNKIGWFKGDGSYGAMPIILRGISADSGQISFYYAYGRYLESGSSDQYDKFVPIDQMPNDPAAVKALQKLVKRYKTQQGRDAEFWGTPPELGQEVRHPLEDAVHKVALHDSYGPVYIKAFDSDDDVVTFQYPNYDRLNEDETDSSRIKPLDEMPNEDRMFKRLRKLVKVLQSSGIQPEFWGNVPSGWEQDNDPYSGLQGKIAYNPSYGPVYVNTYNDEDGEVSVYYLSRRLESAYLDVNKIEKIDNLPNDQEHLAALAKLHRKLTREGYDFDFWGTPPQGWENIQRQAQDFEGKIALTNDYGPAWVQPHDGNTDDEEFRVYYMYGSGLDWTEVYSSSIRPIDRISSAQQIKLRKLVRALQDEGKIEQPQFYGNPPQGWEQEAQRHPSIGKIAFSANYGPVWVHDDDDNGYDDEFSVTYVNSIGRTGTMQLDGYNIKPIDELPRSQIQKLQTLVQQIERGRGQRPQFYGNPPAWAAHADPREAVGKIVYSPYYSLAFYVQSFNTDTANAYYVRQSDGQLQPHRLDKEYIVPFSQIPEGNQQGARQAIQHLQQVLQQNGTQAQVWEGNQ